MVRQVKRVTGPAILTQIFYYFLVPNGSALPKSNVHVQKLFFDRIEMNITTHLEETGIGFDEGFAESPLEELSAREAVF